jgi:hypothetical protein
MTRTEHHMETSKKIRGNSSVFISPGPAPVGMISRHRSVFVGASSFFHESLAEIKFTPTASFNRRWRSFERWNPRLLWP